MLRKLTLVLILVPTLIKAQSTATPDTSWKIGGIASLSFNQSSFTNWVAGGNNSMALNGIFSGFANYKKNKWVMDNSLLMAYGMTKVDDQELRKNDDRIELNIKPGYQLNNKWYLSYLLNVRTQFDKGYDFNAEPKVLTSEFLSPAFFVNALGVEYKPNDNFYFFASPLTIKTTYINASDSKIPHALYGVDADKNARNEFGFYASLRYKCDIMKNISLQSKLDLFSNYSENPQNVDLNGEVLIGMKVNKYISVTLGFAAIYDDDVFVPKGKNDQGVVYYGKGLQFKQTFGVGFTYNMGAAVAK